MPRKTYDLKAVNITRPHTTTTQPVTSATSRYCAHIARPMHKSHNAACHTARHCHHTQPVAHVSTRQHETSHHRITAACHAVPNGRQEEPPKVQTPVRTSLELVYESDKSKGAILKSQGLHRAPLSGGVKTATTRFELPTPPVAVRNLVELARFGHLCTTMSAMHHRRAGYPFGTLVDFAADGAGHPIFCLSPLAIHSRNLLEEPRASLVVQMPGWTGLANARVTIFGDVYPLPAEQQAAAKEIFFNKHSSERKERWVSGNFVYFRMNRIVDVYFVGGFGTVQWIAPSDFLSSRPDEVVLDRPTATLQTMTETFGEQLKTIMQPPGQVVDEVLFISIDASGVDVRLRMGSEFCVERINFGGKVVSAAQAMEQLDRVIQGHTKQPLAAH